MALSVVAAAAVWVFDSAVDAFIFHEHSFLAELLFDVTPHELFIRSVFILCLLLFGFFVSRIVAKRIQAEEKLKILSTAMESSMDGIAIYNRDGRYVYVNQSYSALNGYENPKEILGKTFRLVYGEKELRTDGGCSDPDAHKKRKLAR